MSKIIFSSKPKPKNYFSTEMLILKLTGLSLSDNTSIFYKVYSGIFFICNISYIFIALYGMYGVKITEDAETIAFNITMCLALAILLTAIVHRRNLQKLLHKLAEEPFLPDVGRGSATEEILLAKWFSLQKIQSYAFYVSITLYLSSGIVYTFIKHHNSDNPLDWKFFFGKLTVLNVTNKVNYKVCWTFQVVSVPLIAIKVCPVMVVMYGTLSYACVQLQMLQHYLQIMVTKHSEKSLKNQSEESSDESAILSNLTNLNAMSSWKNLQAALKRAVSHHLKILEIISEAEEIFSMLILLTYFSMLGSLCIIIYAISLLPPEDPQTLTLIIAAVAMCGFPLPVCYWGEQIAHESEQVAKAAYEAYIVGTDLRFQIGLILIMGRSQRTVRIKAGKLVDTSMITYGWILRTAFSYFMVIRNMNMEA